VALKATTWQKLQDLAGIKAWGEMQLYQNVLAAGNNYFAA